MQTNQHTCQASLKSKPRSNYVSADNANSVIEKQINAAFTAKTGIKVEQVVVPGDDIYKKIDMDLASSVTTIDVIPLANPLPLDHYVKNGYLLPLNELLKADQYDAKKILGKYLTKYDGDIIYSLPESVSVWAVFYNKKIFDHANVVPYPLEECTWTQYIDTAKRLTGKYGVHLVGSWYTGLLTNTKDYPKDWEWGVTQIPTDGKGMNTFGVTYTHAVNKHSKHKKEALEYVKFKAEYAARIRGILPALADPIAQEIAIEQIALLSGGSVTADDLANAFFDNKLGYIEEKNTGPAAHYLTGQRSLDDTVKAIIEKANEAIRREAEHSLHADLSQT